MGKEKKEIWKLLELLNEYSKNIWYFNEEDLQWQVKAWILSKEFWWIKWLVENDKIDIKALVVKGEMRSWWDFDNKKWNEESGEEIWNKYYSELCLMLLSISDTPIEDLILYLK